MLDRFDKQVRRNKLVDTQDCNFKYSENDRETPDSCSLTTPSAITPEDDTVANV